jgi:hypothetical protein
LVAIQPHINDGSWTVPFCNELKARYGFTATPSVAIDGTWQVEGTYGSCTLDANAYRNAINARLNNTGGQSPIALSGTYTVDGGVITLTATFELLDAVTLVSPKAYFVVTESNIQNGAYRYQHVVRAGASEAVTTLINPGDQVTITKAFPVGAWNMNNVHCVAFLQRTTGALNQKQVYQAADLPEGSVASVDETLPAVASSIHSIMPNPFSPVGDMLGSTSIRLRVSEHAADRMARLDVVDINGRVVRNLVDRALPLGLTDANWDGRDTAGDPVSTGVYYLRFETADGTHSARAVVIR